MNTIGRIYEYVRQCLDCFSPKLFRLLTSHKRIVKYIISGGTAAVVNLVLLFVFTELAHIWYLYSAVIAFIVSFWVSFLMQKFWTFRDNATDRIPKQIFFYLTLALVNLGLNTLFLYLMVSEFGAHYLLAEIVIGLTLAISTFFVNKLYIFHHTHA